MQQHEKELYDASPKKQESPDKKPVEKVVYLTFDDGPTTLTSQFLEVLKEQNIKVTFL
ncbi:Polysaccharide deacetylase [Lysinibacillus sp. AC-3]|nr:Polysaccharide deacetylase [Lysinibacillus sp. AC-3]